MIPWFQYTVIHIGPVPIQVWGLFVAMGMVLSMWILEREAKKRLLDTAMILDIALKMIVSGVVFARIFHIVFYEPAFFLANPIEVFAIWHGGLSSFGGVFGALLVIFSAIKKGKISKKQLPLYGNMLSFAALYGWLVGRIGCVMIHDHLGAPCDCFLAFNSPEEKRLDMAFLEIICLLPLAGIFFVLKKKHINHLFTPILFIYYGILRFILDFWRAAPDFATGDTRYLGLTPAQYLAMVLVIMGLCMLKKIRNTHAV